MLATSAFQSAALGDSYSPDGNVILSTLSKDEKLCYLERQGVNVPDDYVDFVISIIPRIEEDPDYPCLVSNPVLCDLTEDVKNAVNDYYGRADSTPSRAANSYVLQDSTVYGSWDESYINYNCYAYALGRTDSFYWPGKLSTVPSWYDFDRYESVYVLACHVKADLQSATLSNQCVVLTDVKPTSLSDGQSCICIRTGDGDFHFMKLSGSSWYHKPGMSNPLKYNYEPSTTRPWTNEGVFRGVAHEPDTIYDGDIYYLIYSTNHGTSTYRDTGDNYHSGSRHYYQYGYQCDTCGEFTNTIWRSRVCSGPPCPVVMGFTSICQTE